MLWSLVLVLSGLAVAGEGAEVDTLAGLIAEMQAAADSLLDATWTMHSLEWVGGQMRPAQTIQVKFRRPLDVYMVWTGDVGNGRELLYREGWNKGRMRVNPEGLIPPMNLDPTGNLAMRDARHPVMRTSILSTVDLFVTDMARIKAHAVAQAAVVDLGVLDVYGEPSRCMRIDLPRDQIPELYAEEIEACFSLRTRLPTRSRAYEMVDGVLTLVEEYAFEAMEINVGLTDADFEPDNPDYRL